MGVLGQFIGTNSQGIADLQGQVAQLERRLAQEKRKTHQLIYMLKALSEGIFAIAEDGTISFWSYGLEQLLGVSYEQALGKQYLHFFPGIAKLDFDPFKRIYAEQQKIVIETGFARKERIATADTAVGGVDEYVTSMVPIEISFSPMFTDDGKTVAGVLAEVENIGDRKNIEKMQLDFVSIITHELRTPATNIKGYLSLLLNEDIALSEEHQKFIRRAYVSNERLIHTIESLLTVSKIEEQSFVPELEAVQMETIAAEMSQYFTDDVRAKGLGMRVSYPQYTLPKVWADASYVRQIMYVLLSNAVKFTNAGEVVVGFKDEGNVVSFTVKDTGVGIPDDKKDTLFKRFSRTEHVLTEETQGIGLGLYSAKMMAEKMNGKIFYESVVGQGSIFTVSLPIVST